MVRRASLCIYSGAVASREGADASAGRARFYKSHEIRLRGFGPARLAVAFGAVSSGAASQGIPLGGNHGRIEEGHFSPQPAQRRNAFRRWRGCARHVWLQPVGRLVELEQQGRSCCRIEAHVGSCPRGNHRYCRNRRNRGARYWRRLFRNLLRSECRAERHQGYLG